jgi:hypothetical protein
MGVCNERRKKKLILRVVVVENVECASEVHLVGETNE